MASSVYVGDYNFNLLAASLLRKDRCIKDYFYNIDQRHLTLGYKLNEIENLNSIDDLMSVSYEKIIITNLNSSNIISVLTGMGLLNFSVIDYKAYPLSVLRPALEFVMGAPDFYDESITKFYWDLRADDIHQSWGEDPSDYDTLEDVINYIKPACILDIGCGSGRLFNLYSRLKINELFNLSSSFKINEIVGQDISQMALNIAAARNLPNVKFLNCKIEELEYEPKHFDLIISNRVLAAIPAADIGSVMDKLCYLGKSIYINELLPEEENNNAKKCPYFIAHNYALSFQERGYKIDRSGSIVNQKWFLFKEC
jgi:SAM-dependent methyltransferase